MKPRAFLASAAIMLATTFLPTARADLRFLPGKVMREFYLNIDFLGLGSNFGPLANSTNYPNFPDIRELVTGLSGDQYYDNRLGGGTENYAQRIAGHLFPPLSGTYTFLMYT